MKQGLKKWILRLTLTGLCVLGLLLVIILNPILTYANETVHKNYTIFHDKPLAPALKAKLDQSTELLKTSELYDTKLRLEICLNDGSKYPEIMQIIRGRAFAWGFYDKVVLQGSANYQDNYVELSGYKWNLTQLLAHEITHCLQFNEFGFWKSNPVADIPNWKWEGYAEYVSRQNNDQKDLTKNIAKLISTDQNTWEIQFADSTITAREYYDYWILVQYCMDIKKINYGQILSDTTKEQELRQEMMKWYEENKEKQVMDSE